MSYNKKTPGVYVEELQSLPGSVSAVSTAVPAFIGYTVKAGNGDLYYRPTRVANLTDFERTFGTGPDEDITVNTATAPFTVEITNPAYLMYYSMRMFFENGGEGCYIVAVNKADAATAANQKTAFQKAIDALEFEDEPTLIVLVDGINLSGNNYYDLAKQVLTQCNAMKDRFAILDVPETAGNANDDAVAFRSKIDMGKDFLKYGAAYYPYLQTSLRFKYSSASVKVILEGQNDKVALSAIGEGTKLYNDITAEIDKYYVTLPPSAAVAGAYAVVDRERGVWKAPANVGFVSVIGPNIKLTESENDNLNDDADTGKSINAIRGFTGKGTLIWGARTLAGNDNEWRYIPVRRLFNFVEESIKKATAFAVFEPNTAMTWLKLRSMVESFLDNLWREGALAGGKPEDAYFVQVGLGTTMTSQDILEGRLIIKVGLAAIRPAEFIILEFTHKLQES